ncbi:ATP-binding protein [Epibacterium ulvae]|uniref:ATP-binding protein n=1 Tax=Epibacterium ulvae TaxID=1156985 RepID=UPI001BFCB6C5|nr:ATP-binding protein [Epibacterium ulvae]MBT8153475.1 ATP-binding protein [Epibacterium ulvae]
MEESFACSFAATELEARTGINSVVDQLRDRGIPETRIGEVQIALAEAVNNVVEHAYAGNAPGDVNIRCQLEEEKLSILIRDAGAPIPNEQLPAGEAQSLEGPMEDLPEGGFGWFLIRELTSDIQYERSEGENNLQLSFEIQMRSA